MNEEEYIVNKGDYVRTKGYITKIDGCTCWEAENQWYISYTLPNGSNCGSAVTDEFKISPNPNIIDLIEVGDYVNGKRVTDVDTVKKKIYVEEMYYFNEKDIETIVTKEQFSAMEYKVESEVK